MNTASSILGPAARVPASAGDVLWAAWSPQARMAALAARKAKGFSELSGRQEMAFKLSEKAEAASNAANSPDSHRAASHAHQAAKDAHEKASLESTEAKRDNPDYGSSRVHESLIKRHANMSVRHEMKSNR